MKIATAKKEAPSEATNSIWWTHRELNPEFVNANDAVYRLPTGPKIVQKNFYQLLLYQKII